MNHCRSSALHALALCAPLLITSCANEVERAALDKIKDRYGAASCMITYGMESGTGSYVTLELSGVDDLDSYRNPEFLTSTSAKEYYGAMDAEQLAEYAEIRVSVEGGGSKFEKAYSVDGLKGVAPAYGLVEKYMERLEKGTYASAGELLDTRYLNDSSMAVVNATYAQIDSAQGPFVGHGIIGFDLAPSSDGTPLVWVWCDAATADSTVYNFTFAMDPTTKRLARIAFE